METLSSKHLKESCYQIPTEKNNFIDRFVVTVLWLIIITVLYHRLNVVLLFQFNCCGFYGPKEFAYTNYPISNSCYDTIQEVTSENFNSAQQLKQVSSVLYCTYMTANPD